MNTQKQKTDTIAQYREQLRRCARSLAVARTQAVRPYLPSPAVAPMVDVFIDGNLAKRIWKLSDQFEFMQDAFPALDDWFQEYIRTVPLQAYDIGTSDSLVFLQWVRQNKKLTPEQADYATCHESRVAVEETARRKRLAHVRFQDILSSSEQLADEFGTDPELRIYLNPVRVRGTFTTRVLLDEEAVLPAEVVFYPVESDIRTAVLEPEGKTLLAELERIGPCRLEQLLVVMEYEHQVEHDTVMETCRALAEMGLVAFG